MNDERRKFLEDLAVRLFMEGAMSHNSIAMLINALIREFERHNYP